MANPTPRPAAHFEVDDSAAAFKKFEDFTRRALAVPKKEVDKAAARHKAKKHRPKG
jgi:hypothetical protein